MTERDEPRPPLFAITGDASPEEVAALTAVLQGLAAADAGPQQAKPVPAWSAPARAVRRPVRHGLGGWRASSLP